MANFDLVKIFDTIHTIKLQYLQIEKLSNLVTYDKSYLLLDKKKYSVRLSSFQVFLSVQISQKKSNRKL